MARHFLMAVAARAKDVTIRNIRLEVIVVVVHQNGFPLIHSALAKRAHAFA